MTCRALSRVANGPVKLQVQLVPAMLLGQLAPELLCFCKLLVISALLLCALPPAPVCDQQADAWCTDVTRPAGNAMNLIPITCRDQSCMLLQADLGHLAGCGYEHKRASFLESGLIQGHGCGKDLAFEDELLLAYQHAGRFLGLLHELCDLVLPLGSDHMNLWAVTD